MSQMALGTMMFFLLLIMLVIYSVVKILKEYEKAVVFTFGRVRTKPRGPGIIFLIPGVETMLRMDMRTLTLDVPTQDVITRDNVSVKVNAVVYFRVVDANRAVIQVEDYYYATSQLAQTTLRTVCGEVELDDLLVSREVLNSRIQEILDQGTETWGIKVSMVEIKQIDLGDEVRRAMGRQAEAERERRAKIIAAEGELQAAEKLSEAARIIGSQPQALQLRYLQTLVEIAAENNSTTIFPIPIDFLSAFVGNNRGNPR